MKRFKFRTWDKEAKVMEQYYGLQLAPNGELYHGGMNVTCHYEIMQCTGLKDNHGNDIYEDDVVTNELYNYQVKFGLHTDIYKSCNCGWYLQVIGENNSQHGICDDIETNLIEPLDYLEVIGNIYENPELLEIKKESPCKG